MKYNFDEKVDRKNSLSVKWSDLDQGKGKEILPMWIADMDFKAADEILDALREAVDHGVLGYNVIPESFYESVINWTKKRHGWEIKREWLVFTPGVVPGLNIVVSAFAEKGHGVIVQPPVYPPFFRVMESNNTKAIENPIIHNGKRYVMDLKDLEKKIDEKTKLAMLCSPHNPLGRVWEKEELKEFGDLCVENNIIIVSDEIHCDLTFKDHQHVALASISKEISMNTITFMAPTKTFNIAGLYCSVAIIENKEIRNKYIEAMEKAESTNANLFGVVGFEAAYKHGEKWLDEALEYIEDNADYVVDYVEKNMPEIKTYKPDGTYLLWLDFNGLGKTSAEIEDLLINKGRVKLNNGSDYGVGGDGFFRLNIGCTRKTLEEGLKRIKESIK